MYVSILRVISIDVSIWNISRKKFSGLKKFLWTLSRYSGCFMWNVEVGLSSGRRDARFFCKAFVRGKMTTFWEDEQLEDGNY